MKKVFLVFCILALAAHVFAATLSETHLSELGIEELSVDGANSESCREFEFLRAGDFGPEKYAIFSLHAQFLPVASRESTAVVSLNGEELKTIKSTSFVNEFARIDLPHEKLIEKNELKVCLKTSFTTTKAVFLNDSMVGYYLKPDFSKQDSFLITEISPQSPLVFQEFRVKAVLKNYGSEDAQVVLKYRRDSLEKETPETELVKGKTVVPALVQKCIERNEQNECIEPGQASIEFFLRPKIVGPITLLPAVAEFENEFGEMQLIESNRPSMVIREPEIKLRAFLKTESEEFFAGQPLNAKLVLVNDGITPLFNLIVKIKADGIEVSETQKTHSFEFIGQKQVIEKDVVLTPTAAGTFLAGCEIEYLDLEFEKGQCDDKTLEVKEPSISSSIISAALLFLIAGGTAIYIFYLKK